MSLDQPTAAFLDMLRSSGAKPLYELPLDESRANMVGGSQQLGAPAEPVESVVDRRIDVPGGTIGLRIHSPVGAAAAGPLPAVLQFHGGGFVLGNLDSHESIARFYCARAGAVVVSVDYRLAPEHRFPTQVEDSYAALSWVVANAGELGVDPARIAVAGDSAGGNLATVMCLLAKARGGPRIACQALLYPVTDFRKVGAYASHAEFGDGSYFLSTKDMEWFRSHYFADPTQYADTTASPIAAADLSGLPPALVTTAGCDPLRDEGRAYADRLAAAGVPVEYRCFDATIHACASFAGAIPAGREMLAYVADWLRSTMAAATKS
jgi:acetyl esterase